MILTCLTAPDSWLGPEREDQTWPGMWWWSKAFLEAEKNGLTIDSKRDATPCRTGVSSPRSRMSGNFALVGSNKAVVRATCSAHEDSASPVCQACAGAFRAAFKIFSPCLIRSKRPMLAPDSAFFDRLSLHFSTGLHSRSETRMPAEHSLTI